MYAKCGELEDARQFFDSMDTKVVVTWNALIARYAQQGLGQEALVVYGQMEEAGLILADHVTFAYPLKACASTGAIQKGRVLHSKIVERGLLDDVVVGTCLVDMYAKCGRWSDVDRIETQRWVAGANKKPAVASNEVNKEVHRFLVGERRMDIALKVESTNARVKQEGAHVPHTQLVRKPLRHIQCITVEQVTVVGGLYVDGAVGMTNIDCFQPALPGQVPYVWKFLSSSYRRVPIAFAGPAHCKPAALEYYSGSF